MKRRDLLWHYVYIVFFAGLGAACLWLDRICDYTIPMTAVGFCWLALAAQWLVRGIRRLREGGDAG